MKIRALIVDDKDEMRLIMRKALEKLEQVIVVDEARNGIEAVNLVREHNPDCVFLDVEMPECDGVSAARAIKEIDEKIKIIFVTAHQEYMPQAFEMYAFDYMVKPFRFDRLSETIKKMHLQKEPEKVILKMKDGFEMVDPEDIVLIQREERTTAVITKTGKIYVTSTLSELMETLPSKYFIRSHKSYIVNYRQIKKLSPYGRWTYICEFYDVPEDALITSKIVKDLDLKMRR